MDAEQQGYGAHAFGIVGDAKKKTSSFQAFYDARERILPWIKEYSPYAARHARRSARGPLLRHASQPRQGRKTRPIPPTSA
jgi:hypothetical protein